LARDYTELPQGEEVHCCSVDQRYVYGHLHTLATLKWCYVVIYWFCLCLKDATQKKNVIVIDSHVLYSCANTC